MAAVQCDNFVGNAWKKDLCLNCFKSKEEHIARNGYMQSLMTTRIPDPPKEGILKGTKSRNSNFKRANKVIFHNTEFEVIGFGGDDSYSDDDYPDFACNQAESEDIEDTEEDRAFQKLTKTNTDYNSIPENLQEPKEGEVKKLIEPLKLGKQVFDDKGKKKTLLVSVTPFGDQSPAKNKVNVNGIKSTLAVGRDSNLNGNSHDSDVAKKPVKTQGFNEKTEGTLLERNGVDTVEGTPTKANGTNGDVTDADKNVENVVEIAQLNGDDSSGKVTNDKNVIKRSQPLDKNFKFRLIKDFQKENEKNSETGDKEETQSKPERIKTSEKVSNLIDKAKKKVNQFPVIADGSNFKFKTKDFTNSCLKKSTTENNKAIVLDMYKIREKEDVKTINEINEEKMVKGLLTSSEIRAKFLTVDAKTGKSSGDLPKPRGIEAGPEATKDPPLTGVASIVKEVQEKFHRNAMTDRAKLVPNMSSLYRHHLRNAPPSKPEEPNQTEIVVKPLMNGVVSSTTLGPSTECKVNGDLRSEPESADSEEGDETTKNLPEEKTRPVLEEPVTEMKFKKIALETIGNFDNIMKGEEIILFSADKGVDLGRQPEDDGVQRDAEEEGRESDESLDDQGSSDDSLVPPALPTKPPPLLDSRTYFLHELTIADGEPAKTGPEKPKVPAKPIIIHSKRTNFQSPIYTNRPKSPSMEKFLDATGSPQVRSHPPLQETFSSDSGKNQKRPAPKPPSPKEDLAQRFVAGLAGPGPFDSEQKNSCLEESSVKRMSRSTENLLEFIADQEEKSQLSTEGLEEISLLDSPPRRSLSLSQDSLMPCELGDLQAKKKPSRGKFFLQKLLHLGKPKETSKDLNPRQRSSAPTVPKPKIEIIHPSDLNGSRVEVVPPARTFKSRRTSSSASSSSGEHRESDVLSDSSTSHSVSSSGNDSSSTNDQSKKPPPPPRAHSADPWNPKPARPPPPKSIEILRQNSTWCNSVGTKLDSLYVNLGEARSGLAPNKPVRTGSLREANPDNMKRLVPSTIQPDDSDYESFIVPSTSPPAEDNLYECVPASNNRSSLPECDSLNECPNSTYPKGKRSGGARDLTHRRSEGNVEVNSDCFKMRFLRSVSLPYCASETESEIYSPYSFYGSELGEEDYDVSSSNHILRMSRLKLKKGRSIVHKNLEDNYGAVVVANHEALAQVVEQMRQGPAIPPALRALTTAVNLRWTDFVIAKDTIGVVVERRIFYPAFWGSHGVTLSLMAEQGLNSSLHAKGPFNLNPIAELNDLVPASYLSMLRKDGSEMIQASISVLARLQIDTIDGYGKNMRSGVHSDDSKKEVNFVLLQVINAFKSLQAQGIEEVSRNLTNLVVCREEKDPHPRICITDSFERSTEGRDSLCQSLINAINEILPPTDLTPLIASVLQKEKAVSLSQAKGILEFALWGPADIAFGSSCRERESALQRWLDLERATVLHGLVRTRAELTVFEEWQLLFLVRTSAKIMAEASLLLENGIGEDVSTA